MSPVRSLKNQYLGINAQLHSALQGAGGWNSFHASHITHLLTLLKARLRPMGYTAELVKSLQIRRYDEPVGKPESDVTVFDLDPTRPYEPHTPLQGGQQQLVLAIPQALGIREPTKRQYEAIQAYQVVPGQSDKGTPVAWFELLSPSNKPGGQDADEYREKRLKILQSGLVLIEMDYLHESAPTLEGIPNYRIRRNRLSESASHPYRILVMDPRPEFMEGQAVVTEFDVDTPIPTVTIPLNGDDILDFDFGAPYDKTFMEVFYGDEVDYNQLPLNFERYSPDDQTRIVARMLSVLEAARSDLDLEQGSFPVKAVTLEEGLSQLAMFNY